MLVNMWSSLRLLPWSCPEQKWKRIQRKEPVWVDQRDVEFSSGMPNLIFEIPIGHSSRDVKWGNTEYNRGSQRSHKNIK